MRVVPVVRIEASAGTIEKIVTSLGEVRPDAAVCLESDGVQAVVADPAMVMMGRVEVDPEAFGEYQVDGYLEPGLRLEKLEKILGLYGQDAEVVLELDEDQAEISSSSMSNRVRHVEQDEDDQPSGLDQELPAEVSIAASRLNGVVAQAEIFTDRVELVAQDDVLEIAASGDDGQGRTELELDEPVDERLETMLSLDYLDDAAGQLADVGDQVTIELGDDLPVRLSTDSDGINVEYLIAPRIEEE